MIRNTLLVLVVLTTATLEAEPASGGITGVVHDQTQSVVAGAMITVKNLNNNATKSTVTGVDGTYHIGDLDPGDYEVVARRGGFSDFKISSLRLDGNGAARGDITLSPAAPKATPGFWKRFGQAYWDDWHPAAATTAAAPAPGAEPPYRGYPPPVSNPPFPFNVWPIGGTVWIGYNNATQYPLTTALQTGPHGEWWKKHNIQIYGWIDASLNVSTSSAKPYGNLPAAYAEVPNSIQLDQFTLYFERTPDTIQTDHFDWGFRITNLYGLDYRFTTAMGYFSQQLLNNPQRNGSIGNRYGYDPVMMYVDLYYPHVAQGLDVRIGRYISLPDIEAQLAPNNYTFSHSLLYTYDCYTQTGINGTFKLNNHWQLQVGLSGGCEAAPWAPDAQLTGNVCANYNWTEGHNNIYICANSLNSGKYNYNNLAAYYITYYHKFANSNWHVAWEAWYQYMKDTPNIFNPQAASLLITNSNGAYCNHPTELTCFAPEWATVYYINRYVNKSNYISLRTEWFDDLKGQRTGFKTKYLESLLAWNHWIGSTVVFRPEFRVEHSFDMPAYNGGAKQTQVMFAADVIWFY